MSNACKCSTKTLPAVVFVTVLAIFLGAVGLHAQQLSVRSEQERNAYRAAMEEADQKIVAAENDHSEVVQNEEYLTTYIGPRLTGSPAMQKASQWTLEMFRKYGLDVHLETSQIPHAWYRGNDWGELVTPVQHWMTIRSATWSKAIPGPVAGPLVITDGHTTAEDILKNPQKYKGAIVLADAPPGDAKLPENPPNAFRAVVPAHHGVTGPAPTLAQVRHGLEESLKFTDALAKAGVVAMLRDSRKPNSLMSMGTGGYPPYQPSTIPTAYVSHPDYLWLLRLAKAGTGTFRINLDGKFSEGPAPTSITVAQIRGSEHPDEQVIVGGHLDSNDLGEGAVDNGTGAMAVLEAARLLKSLGWTPKRTLTFVLFTGEEQGGNLDELQFGGMGPRIFLKNHANEIDKISAMLVLDTGAGRVTSITLENFWSTAPLMEEIYRPLQEVFDLDPMSNEYIGSSDHVAFQWNGVPAYLCVQSAANYGYAVHSQQDVFEVVDPEALRQQAALLAAWMWNVSEMPESLPHHAKGVRLDNLK